MRDYHKNDEIEGVFPSTAPRYIACAEARGMRWRKMKVMS